jgi:2-polyprenyl-3-methyl-5-hydroxy-6-metoxy-1,4-benzoquinol methylase
MAHMLPANTNVHIPYDLQRKPYHKAVADLVRKHTPEKGEVLDIGCGVGRTLVEVQQQRPDLRLVASDMDAQCLAITAKHVDLGESIQATADNLFSTVRQFDCVIASHVLEHTHHPVDFVQGVMGLLKPGGVAVLAVPNPVRPTVMWSNLFRRHYVNRGHVVAWDRSHWINFLENILDLNVVEYASDFVPLPLVSGLPGFRRLEAVLARVTPWLAFSNIAAVRKESDA